MDSSLIAHARLRSSDLPAAYSAHPPDEATPSPPVRRLRVLLAEDNPINRIFARALLERLGHEVIVAQDGTEALDVLARERIDVVLMDISMPRVDGLEATRCIRRGAVHDLPPDVPVIAVTAHALAGDRERFLAAGMDDYISKPIDPDALRRVLDRVRREAK